MSRHFLLIVILLVLSAPGCHKKTAPPPASLTDAEKKFVEICRKEHKLNVQVFDANNTVWIYLPMTEELIDYHGTNKDDTAKSKKQFTISTFEGNHADTRYRFLLDITDSIKTSKDPGYKSDATEAFIKNRLTIYGVIGEVFFDLEKDKSPEFIVLVIANVKKAVAYKTVMNLNDYKQYRSEVLTSEEYNLREISELYGDKKLTGDYEGKNLIIKPITWSWFFIEQIKNRVNFRFLRSDFPPDKDIIIEIASIIADTFRYYQYVDYSDVLIKDLRDNASYTFNRPQISSFEETANKVHSPSFRMQYLTTPGQAAH